MKEQTYGWYPSAKNVYDERRADTLTPYREYLLTLFTKINLGLFYDKIDRLTHVSVLSKILHIDKTE